MSDTPSQTSPSTAQPAASAKLFAAATQNGSKLLETWSHGPSSMLQAGFGLYQDWLELAQADLAGSMEAWRSLVSCRDMEGLARCQTRLADEATTRRTGRMDRVLRRWVNTLDGATANPSPPARGRGE